MVAPVKALSRYMRINLGGFAAFVPQQGLDIAQVGAIFQQVSGKAVPQGMDARLFLDAYFLKNGLNAP
jgi:hypothetical protein